MDGRNSFGRRISLLNDDLPTLNRKPASSKYSPAFSTTSSFDSSSNRLPSFSQSRSSSCDRSTPSYSPQTPPLVRSNSSDSMDMDVPSPITPEFVGEVYNTLPTATQLYPQTTYMSQSPKNANMNYPPVPAQNMPLPYPPHVQQSSTYKHISRNSQSLEALPVKAPSVQQAKEADVSTTSQPTKTKKGQHPCPLAKQYNCSDTFTTSGHASRHAKKHTGEKSAICPDCGKDFTRKDNMEQHRKTHLNGRNANKGRNQDPAKTARSQSKRPKPSPLQTGASGKNLDSSMSIASVASVQHSLPDFVPPSQDSSIRSYTYSDMYNGAPISALHALATACSDEKRYMSSY